MNSNTEQNKNEPEPISGTEESEMAQSSYNFSIVELKDDDIVEKTILYIQVNHVIEEPKMMNTEAGVSLKKTVFSFIIHLESFIHKTAVNPKLLQLKLCARNKLKERSPKEYSPVFSEITEQFGSLIAGDRIVVIEELKRQVLDALYFGHPGSTKQKAICFAGPEGRKTSKINAAHALHARAAVRNYSINYHGRKKLNYRH